MTFFTEPAQIDTFDRGINAKVDDLDTAINDGFVAAEATLTAADHSGSCSFNANVTDNGTVLCKTHDGFVMLASKLTATGAITGGFRSLIVLPANCTPEAASIRIFIRRGGQWFWATALVAQDWFGIVADNSLAVSNPHYYALTTPTVHGSLYNGNGQLDYQAGDEFFINGRWAV